MIPVYEDFAAAAADADYVSIGVPLAFDHETVIALADRFVGRDQMFLLESATLGPNARYSFLGFDPLWTFTVRDPGNAAAGPDPLAGLRARIAGKRLRSVWARGARLGGPDVALMPGPVGYFGYDTIAALEPAVGRMPPRTLDLPTVHFFMPRTLLVVDHLSRRLFLVHTTATAGLTPPQLRAAHAAAGSALAELAKELATPHVPPALNLAPEPPDDTAARSALTKAEFFGHVEACLEAIRAGEIFQIQIGNRLSVATAARPFDVFRHLRMLNPSPYMFFYRIGTHHILGASPEMMVNVQGRAITHRPIAGTRRRTWEPREDARMRRELVESEKERAEHVMLVDLARNDVGRVAAPGSVRVDELMTVEEYSHVFHMVSQVSGTLADGLDAFDALRAGFPNGTVTGAPKIRAMQLINTRERISREFYAGCLGMFDFQGNLRSTILIRTIHMADGVASTQASAGIVYDSVPDQEWLETRNKMAACLTAMQRTGAPAP